MKLVVGQTLYEDTVFGIKERKITSIGTKYFSISNTLQRHFNKKTLDFMAGNALWERKLFLTKEEINEQP